MEKRLNSDHLIRELDKVDYQKPELEKHLKLQTIKVTITQSDEDMRWRRTLTREDNEEGQFHVLLQELAVIAKQYMRPMDEVFQLY